MFLRHTETVRAVTSAADFHHVDLTVIGGCTYQDFNGDGRRGYPQRDK